MVQEKLKKELIAVLENELSAHRQILALLGEEKDQIVKDPVALNEITKKKDVLVENIRKLEETRQRLIMSLSGILGVSVKDITLVLLSRVWSEPRLVSLRKELKAVLEEIKSKQQINSALIQHALASINNYVNLLANNPKDMLYGPKGDIKDSKSAYYRHLNRKI
jgi:flagellar biosynthesis/type III secretory pathway chaperone